MQYAEATDNLTSLPAKTTAIDSFEYYGWKELLSTQFREPSFLDSRGWIPDHGFTFFQGDGNVGKGWVTLDLCIDVMLEGHKVMLLSAEDSAGDLKYRIESVARGNKRLRASIVEYAAQFGQVIDVDDLDAPGGIADQFSGLFDVVPGTFRLDKPESEMFKRFKERLDAFQPDLLIVDPLSNYMSGSDSSDEDCKNAFLPLEGFVTNGGSVLVIHHTQKHNRGQYRGSSVIYDRADAEYTIRKVGGHSNIADFTCTKARHFKKPQHAWRITRNEVTTDHEFLDGTTGETLTKKLSGITLDYETVALTDDETTDLSVSKRILLAVKERGDITKTDLFDNILKAKKPKLASEAANAIGFLEAEGLIVASYITAKNNVQAKHIRPSDTLDAMTVDEIKSLDI